MASKPSQKSKSGKSRCLEVQKQPLDLAKKSLVTWARMVFWSLIGISSKKQ